MGYHSKAKITKDEVQELLLEATSDENWQTSTTILHALADAAYNYQQWQKISSFIWEKLKSKKWKKILKTLNLIEFLLKNGPPSILSSFKYQVYQFRSFESFNCYDEGIDRGESIREKAKAVVELLSNEQLLEEERLKAKTIRERLAGSGDSGYSGYGGRGNNYGGVSYKNEGFGSGGGSKYAGYSNKTATSMGGSSSGGGYNSMGTAFGAYSEQKSTLDKYRNQPVGGSVYTKDKEKEKDKERERERERQREKKAKEEEQSSKVEVQVKKPFAKQAPTLKKPGEVKLNPPQLPQKMPGHTAPQQTKKEVDIFQMGDTPAPVETKPPVQTQQPQVNLAQIPQVPQTPQVPYGAVPSVIPAGVNLINPMYPTTVGLANPTLAQPQVQPQLALINPLYSTTNAMAGLNISPPTGNSFGGFNAFATPGVQNAQQPKPTVPHYGITMNTGVAKKDDDEFGDFTTAASDSTKNVKWLTNDESSLIDLGGFGQEIKQKEKKVVQPEKKISNNDDILDIPASLDSLKISTPTPAPQTFNQPLGGGFNMGGMTGMAGMGGVGNMGMVGGYGGVPGGMNMGYNMGMMGGANYQMTPQQYQQMLLQQQQQQKGFSYR